MPSAARIQWAKFRVITVTIASLLILGTLLYNLFGSALLSPRAIVFLYVPDGSGLSGDSAVRVDGIDVGKVSDVELSHSNVPLRAVKVTLSLDRDRLNSIPADSVAQLSSDSLVGDKFVDISSGTSPKGIAPESEMIYKDQPELLRSLDLVQFTQQLRAIDSMLADIEEGRSQFGKFYNGDAFYNDLEKRLKDLRTAFEDSVSTTSLVGSLITSDVMHRHVTDMIGNIDQTMAKLQAGQGPAGQLLRNSAQYDQLMTTVHGLRTSIQTIAGGELMQSDAAYVNTGQWLAAMIRSVDELNQNPQLNSTFLYDNLNGQLKELRDSIRDFRLNPRKYLRLKVF